MYFTFLWSLFEARALGNRACAAAIISLVSSWDSGGQLKVSGFSAALEHFRGRYYTEGGPSERLKELHLRRLDRPELVQAVLSSNSGDLVDEVSALLIVVYRLRNNLFHGLKWAYELRGQLDNFSYANSVLMGALDVHDQLNR